MQFLFLLCRFCRVAESIDPAGSGVGLTSDGLLGLVIPDIKIRVEGLPGAERCEGYVFKVRRCLVWVGIGWDSITGWKFAVILDIVGYMLICCSAFLAWSASDASLFKIDAIHGPPFCLPW